MSNPEIESLAHSIASAVESSSDEYTVTKEVAAALTTALADGIELDDAVTRPHAERYVMYPLHVDPLDRFSIASAVWNVGQGTPVHGHETWGVVGIHSGQEHEVRYQKPTKPDVPLASLGDSVWGPGEVTICCTTDDDVHAVDCAGDVPCVGIHVYGANIGTLNRRSYDPATGAVNWFVSHWAEPHTA